MPPTKDLDYLLVSAPISGIEMGITYQAEVLGIPGEEHIHLATVASHSIIPYTVFSLNMCMVHHYLVSWLAC